MIFKQNRAHKGPYGPYGPQPGPGPNPDWAPTPDLAPQGVPRKPYFYLFLGIFLGTFVIFRQILRFLVKIT